MSALIWELPREMLTPEEERKKREIFEAMLPRRQERILKKGYDNWDPFQRPKDPGEQIKQQAEEGQRALRLFHEYFEDKNLDEYSDEYARGVLEICRGIIRNDARSRGMYDFCHWHEKKRGENT